jgi:hypothetical protein
MEMNLECQMVCISPRAKTILEIMQLSEQFQEIPMEVGDDGFTIFTVWTALPDEKINEMRMFALGVYETLFRKGIK